MCRDIEVKFGDDLVLVTVEKKGYRSRLWTSYKGIGYLGSYFPKALKKDPNGPIVDKLGVRYSDNKHAGVSGVKYNGKVIEADFPAKGPKEAAKKLLELFLAA